MVEIFLGLRQIILMFAKTFRVYSNNLSIFAAVVHRLGESVIRFLLGSLKNILKLVVDSFILSKEITIRDEN